MADLFQQGGWMMYPLLLSSIVALAIALERSYFILLNTKRLPSGKLSELFDFLSKHDKSDVLDLCQKNPSVLNPLLVAVIEQENETQQEKAASYEGNEVLFNLHKRLSILSTIGSIAPLMGLLGTVLGMIEVFADASALGGNADATLLAGGIWKALITTAFGMTIAIPSLLFYSYLHRHIIETENYLNHNINKVVSLLNTKQYKPQGHTEKAKKDG